MTTLVPSFLIGSSLFLQVTRTTITSRMVSKFIVSSNKDKHKNLDEFEFCRIRPMTYELAALERLEKSPLTYDGRNVVTTLVPSFLDGSSSFLQRNKPTIKAGMSLNFGKIQSLTLELSPLERQKN